MNRYAASVRRLKLQERILPLRMLNMYNWRSPSQRIAEKRDASFSIGCARVSAKYEREHAERIFSNALTTRHGDVHLGTAFHLAERAGVTLCKEEMMNHRKNAKNAGNAPSKNLTHTHVYKKEDNEEPDESEELQDGSDPNQPLPSFTEADWPKILLLIMSYATSPTQRDVMLLGALTAIGASMERYVRCPYARQTPVSLACKVLLWLLPPRVREFFRSSGCL